MIAECKYVKVDQEIRSPKIQLRKIEMHVFLFLILNT